MVNLKEIIESLVEIFLEAGDLAIQLREKGLVVINDMLQRTLKAQMKEANRLGVKYAIIIGEEEVNNNSYTIKDLKKNSQKTLLFDSLISLLKL